MVAGLHTLRAPCRRGRGRRTAAVRERAVERVYASFGLNAKPVKVSEMIAEPYFNQECLRGHKCKPAINAKQPQIQTNQQ